MARPHTIVKNVHSLTTKERQSCLRLNLGDRGMMKERLRIEQDYADNGVDRGVKVILHYDRLDRVDGWGILWYDHRSKPNVYFYVRQAARRQGVGSKLIKRAMKLQRQLTVYPWDETSTKFFMKNSVPVSAYYRQRFGH